MAKLLFSFGIVTDIQYADIENRKQHLFRAAPQKLAKCVTDWNQHDLAFAVQLGDIVQGNGEKTLGELERVLEILSDFQKPMYHVIGNHCLEISLPVLLEKFGYPAPYYDFAVKGFRFIVLHSMEVSIFSRPKDGAAYRIAEATLEKNPELKFWTGALSVSQIEWLRAKLAFAKSQNERVIILNHLPAHEETTDGESGLLWNAQELRELLAESGCVIAHLNGHHHPGGYAKDRSVHFATLEALLDSPEHGTAYGIVEVYEDRLLLKGMGSLTSRELGF
ncbi:metallophosphoesterase [Chloroherpeton thalassium ATCC 35110]|uniref:Metallophosphoesterase n=1 Tax=Chloroherpeton thalassium (strain ATCC 35110 / GB-78) TaxID=517418 RepID=B3QZA8_CHLT3|nr:metallophosphoesterase [Chloroherpeton thalassium ATCC 35110]